MNNKIWNSFVSESDRDQTDAAASDFMPFGAIFLSGLASVLNLLCSFLLLKVGRFLLSLYEELLSTMFERLLGSSGIVAGKVFASTCDSILVHMVDPPRAAVEREA